MPLSRRDFLTLSAALTATACTPVMINKEEHTMPSPIKAVAFDAFVIFDFRPITTLANQLFPTKGDALTTEWRTRQFEYTWLRVAMNRYADFWQVTQDALLYAAKKLSLPLTAQHRGTLMDAYLTLQPWPDVPAALERLKKANLRLAFLSNFTPQMLDACTRASHLEHLFEAYLSTDLAKTYKPTPAAYALGTTHLHLQKSEILFAAFGPWDAAGAKTFGYPTFWVNRANQPEEELTVSPDASAPTLTALADYLHV